MLVSIRIAVSIACGLVGRGGNDELKRKSFTYVNYLIFFVDFGTSEKNAVGVVTAGELKVTSCLAFLFFFFLSCFYSLCIVLLFTIF